MTESTSTSPYRIEALRGLENYPVWKMNMTDILSDINLLEYVLSPALKPSEAALQTALSKAEDKDKAHAMFDASAYATKDAKWMIKEWKGMEGIILHPLPHFKRSVCLHQRR